jgi:hypothetical protein
MLSADQAASCSRCDAQDGRQRPLAVAALEDKVVQRATVAVLNSVYEEEFLGFSYGFRQARAEAAQVLPINPGFTIAQWKCFVVHKYPEDVEHRAEGIRKAGLPER